ncbi:bifunctional hydroxymethylpyrimidine kinase/phosphomethylpyrimidine kinase, partial [Achromobacter sp. GbtcB20]|uniref:bifunctional hydroxymethylpyrimidine kinase/phosphomethylpyrimidine kinase n=1 Tax=Achromobacter sp. GbtcB20 TaxID=2824765 RepID=UPI001C301D3E
QNQPSPLILTFGVSDPVGALGVQADLATFAAHGCHALTVTTALLVGDSARVEDLHEIVVGWRAAQARVVPGDMPVAAVKV